MIGGFVIPLLLAVLATDKDNHGMSERPNYPELANIDLPQPPVPWEPSKRRKMLHSYPDGAFWRILDENMDKLTERFELSEYINWLNEQYMMPGHVVSVVSAMLIEDHPDTNFWHVRDGEKTIMQRVERDLLELEPADTPDGLRWRAQRAGFANGRYPVAVVAKLMNMEPEAFHDYVKDNIQPSGWIIVKSGNYLVPVTIDHFGDNKVVVISGAQELTPDGNKLVDSVLYAYEKGLGSQP